MSEAKLFLKIDIGDFISKNQVIAYLYFNEAFTLAEYKNNPA